MCTCYNFPDFLSKSLRQAHNSATIARFSAFRLSLNPSRSPLCTRKKMGLKHVLSSSNPLLLKQ